MSLRPLSKKRATDEVYDALRAAILSRVFVPGERLIADELSAQLGVSLTPIRHALQQLSVEGLVEIHPRSGTYVANVSAEDLSETFEIRIALELLAAQRAVRRVQDADLARMRSILQSLAKLVKNPEDMKAHESANLEFHLQIFQIAHSKRLEEMYQSLNAHIQIARVHSQEGPLREGLLARLNQEQAEHQAIYDALAAKDLPALEAALRQHILRAQASLVEALALRSDSVR
jgi:GntR family transcriptional regulator, rspAB operon transcriptional repressor